MPTKPPISKDDIRRRLSPIFDRPEVGLIVLFGSHAKGTARADSDVDLAVLVDGDVAELEAEIMHRLGSGRVDVVDVRRTTPLLAMAIARYGIALHESEAGAFASFASLALRRYNDTSKLRASRHRGIRKYLADRGLDPAPRT